MSVREKPEVQQVVLCRLTGRYGTRYKGRHNYDVIRTPEGLIFYISWICGAAGKPVPDSFRCTDGGG